MQLIQNKDKYKIRTNKIRTKLIRTNIDQILSILSLRSYSIANNVTNNKDKT